MLSPPGLRLSQVSRVRVLPGRVYPVAGTGCLKAEEPSGQGAGAISRVPLRRRPCYNARALLRVIPTKVLGLIVDLNGRE